MSTDITLVFEAVMHIPTAVAWRLTALSRPEDHDVRHMDVSSNLNPCVILKTLAKNPVDYIIEEGRGESTSLSNAGADLKGH